MSVQTLCEVTEDEDATVTDTVDELISGVERENILEKIRKKRKFTRKPRQKAPPVLERITSNDLNSRECIIEAGQEGTVPSRVEGGIVVVQVEGFQIGLFLLKMLQ